MGADGKTAQIPDQFATGLKWFNDGVWKDHFIPTRPPIDSDLLGKGNEFQSGNLAMDEAHSWYTCCINPAAPAKASFKLGASRSTPSYNGTITRQAPRRHVQHPQDHQDPGRGVQGPRRLVASPELLTNYGAMPADPTQQQACVRRHREELPRTSSSTWSVMQAMLGLPGQPQPPVLGARLREVRRRHAGLRQQVPNH